MSNEGIHVSDQADSSVLYADVVIVGSGAGGAAIAGALRRSGASVIVVEAGPAYTTKAGRHLRNTRRDPEFDALAAELLKPHGGAHEPVAGLTGFNEIPAVGGNMTAWAHAVPRPHLTEEWDGTYPADEFSADLARAEDLLYANDSLWGQGSLRQQWLAQAITDRLGEAPKRVPLAGRLSGSGRIEFSGADVLLQADANAPLHILTGHTVRRILHSSGRAIGVQCFDVDDVPVTVLADTVVIAAGALGTPQLLHISGLNRPALGRYVTDHLNVISRVYLDDAAPDPNEDGTAPTSLFLPVTEGRPFHTALLDIPSVHHAGVLAGAPRGRTTDIGTFIGTEPDADNHLVFHTEHIDPNGLPHVSAQIRFTETDHSRIATALGFQYQLARSIGSPWLGMNPLFRPAGSSLHVMGTHRMGSDEETSVTNTHGRVHGTENIYLAGNGSIPTRNSCNPTLTTVALALRTADFIAQQTTRSLPTAAVVAEP